MQNENILHQLPGVALSDVRVVQMLDSGSNTYKHSIMLKNITSCEVIAQRFYKFLYYAIMLIVFAIVFYNIFSFTERWQYVVMGIMGVSVICCLILFFFDNEKAIFIKSAHSKMTISGDFTISQALDFTDKVDAAILKFTNGG